MKRIVWGMMLGLLIATGACSSSTPYVVGAIYPLGGGQGRGGISEARGVRLAAELANQDGGVNGRRISLKALDVPGADGAIGAVRSLDEQGIDVVLGSYGSTISRPAAAEAARRGMLFWETGAVGDMTGDGAGNLVFRVSPTGGTLGRQAVSFVAEKISALLGQEATSLRFAIAYVDDVYGRAVARGAREEISSRKLPLAADIAYDAHAYDAAKIVQQVALAKADVLFVSAYLADGVAIRQETVRQHVPLKAAIGTSSSFCMLEFGAKLGADAIGLFASDKPDTGLNVEALTPDARALLERAQAKYKQRYHEDMDPPSLAGFSAAWALFHYVLPHARSVHPSHIAAAAQRVRVPVGGLPNGSGLEFGAPSSRIAGENLRAASVIWEWDRDGKRRVVWPPELATTPVELIPLAA